MATTQTKRPSWLDQYGRSTFVSPDFLLAILAAGATLGLLLSSPAARSTIGSLTAALAGVLAGLLGLALAAMAIVTAFITPTFVAAVGDVRELCMPFLTVAVAAALGLVTALALVMLEPIAMAWWIAPSIMALAIFFAVWAIAGTVQLVTIVIFFASVRAREMKTLLDAEALRGRRLTEAAGSDSTSN